MIGHAPTVLSLRMMVEPSFAEKALWEHALSQVMELLRLLLWSDASSEGSRFGAAPFLGDFRGGARPHAVAGPRMPSGMLHYKGNRQNKEQRGRREHCHSRTQI